LPLPDVLVSSWEVTLMLKISFLQQVAYAIAGLFSKSEGQTWG
jgi:hypothetical protein